MKKVLLFLTTLISILLISAVSYAEPPSAGWNFGNVTEGSVSNSLVLNSLSDNYGISQFQTTSTNGKASQNLGNNDYIPENAVKNALALDGYTQAYDYNPSYSGLYGAAYNQALPTNIPLTKLSFMGLAGNPNAVQDVYVPTSEYNALSAQGQAASIQGQATSINNLTTDLNQTNAQVNTNTIGLSNETSRAQTAESGLQSQINNDGHRIDNLERLKVMPEASIRFYDAKHLSMAMYDDYDATNGRNYAVGMKIELKLGKSYEETLIEKQNEEIARLKRILGVK